MLIYQTNEVLKTCLFAGQIMMSNGAETSRVENTVVHMANSYQLQDIKVVAMPTLIILTVRDGEGNSFTDMVRMQIDERATNFDVVVEVNKISRRLTQRIEDPKIVYDQLQRIAENDSNFSNWQEIAAASIACGAFSFIVGGAYQDILPTIIVTALAVLVYDLCVKKTKIIFFSEFMAAAFIGLMAYYLPQIGFGKHFEFISIGALMCFVPGVAISNTFHDFFKGHMLSGLSMLARSLLTALAVGLGIVVVLNFI